MHFLVTHATTFSYSEPICQSIMEVRKQPRTEGAQRCLEFTIRVEPQARILWYVDPLGTVVHHFNVPGEHSTLRVQTEAKVEIKPHLQPPDFLPPNSWRELDDLAGRPEWWDFLAPSGFAQPTALLEDLAHELDFRRRADPLSIVRELNSRIYQAFEYEPNRTHVDSPIDDALSHRQGVCQDFAHIMIALLRGVGIPTRYVSGYLFHRFDNGDRSAADATHAWVEAYLPGPGWIGFDPTNQVIADDRHIRVALGRDYLDVPPTRGVFTGTAASDVRVEVSVISIAEPPADVSSILPDWIEHRGQGDGDFTPPPGGQ